jgi:hypothetical protein
MTDTEICNIGTALHWKSKAKRVKGLDNADFWRFYRRIWEALLSGPFIWQDKAENERR